jgi:hypothetical protein
MVEARAGAGDEHEWLAPVIPLRAGDA